MFIGESDSRHAFVIDGPSDAGGRNAGPRPMELVLTGIGACTAFDVVSILRKARQSIVDCRVELEADRAKKPPKVFTKIHIHFVITGRDLKPSQVERAVRLSAEKYCSASIMLQQSVSITHDFEIIETG